MTVARLARRATAPAVAAVVALLVSSCGTTTAPEADLGADAAGTETVELPEATQLPEVAALPDARPATGAPTPQDPTGPAAARPAQTTLTQPVVWPAPDVVFQTPEEAAADFASTVLSVAGGALLGDFEQGDSRSGEIAVLFAGETGDLDPPLVRATLSLRQVAPTDGWYVIAASSGDIEVRTPASASIVPAGPVTVSGSSTSFEGTLNVLAFPTGDASAVIAQEVAQGGAMGEVGPFGVDLDLGGVTTGEMLVIMVQGDTGLDTDPGGFAAIPIVISDAPTLDLPATG